MRDRETDSWWSIMTSDAIGGELEIDLEVAVMLAAIQQAAVGIADLGVLAVCLGDGL